MWRHIGSCRYIWNWMLAKQQELYSLGEKHLSAFSMMKLLVPLKSDGEHNWLYDVSHTSLQVVCRDLQKAYDRFFKKQGGFPRFKSRKRSKASYPVRQTIWFSGKLVKIEKLGKVKFKTDFTFPEGREHKFFNPRITNRNGKWILSFGMECESQTPQLTDVSIGIDLGVKDLAIVEYNGEKLVFPNINKSCTMRQLSRKKKHLQRSISRKYEANRVGFRFVKTKNIKRLENKLRRIDARIANIRLNYIHQTTHTLVSLLPYRVVMEDLNVVGMMKNHHLAKAIQEQCFGEFIRQMAYKCD